MSVDWNPDDVRRIVKEEVEAHVVAFPHPSWDSLDGEDADGIVAKTHQAAANSEAVLKNQKELAEKLEALADVVLGEEHHTYDGQVVREGGLQKLVQQSQNGGVRIQLHPAITAAIITATGGVIATLIIVVTSVAQGGGP